jgi:hypothetical protein
LTDVEVVGLKMIPFPRKNMSARRHQYMELAQFSSPTNDGNYIIPAAAAVDSSSIAFCISPTSSRAQGES